MINALKKKFAPPSGSNNHIGQNAIRTGGVVPINSELQKKFSHGVNFNMKVVIRGDRASGKTNLFRRLQGQAFNESYLPTDEIQVANILWNYRTSDYVVKLDVWDVCDASSRRTTKKIDGLKLDNNSQPSTSVDPDLMICDATFINVYQNCNGVLLMFDVTKQWTWQYVCKELDNIPSAIPVLILANKIDLDKQREVHDEEILSFLSNYKRKDLSNNRLKAPIRFTSASTKTNFGLKYIYNFLNIPFLFLQREYLEKSLEANQKEIDIAQYELDCYNRNADSPVDEPNGQPTTTTEDTDNSNKTNGVKLKKHPSNSSISCDENAVNMFEEDFDSNDECHKTMSSYVSKSKLAAPQTDEMLTSFNEILDTNASIAEELSESLNLDSDVQPTETPQKLESPEEKLDSWLDEMETKAPVVEKQVGRRLSSSSSSSDEAGQNPLVAKFEGSEDDESDSQLQSHGSTSCSTTAGYINSPRTKNESKHPKAKTSSSALEDFLSPSEQDFPAVQPKETIVKTKKKTKKASDKPTKKKKSSKRNDASNILVEDQQLAEVNVDQYDPL